MKILSQYKGLKKEVYVISFCKLIDCVGSMIGPMLTLILSIKLGMNASEIASHFVLVMALSLPIHLFSGKLTDKLNKKLIINVCDITTALLYITCGIIGLNKTTLWLYIIGDLLQTAESPAYESLIADYTTTQDRERAYSLNYLCLNFGLVLAPTIGGFLLNDYLGLMFIINGITELISIVIFDINVKNIYVIEDNSNKYERRSNEGNVFKILKQNKILIVFIIIFGISITTYSMWSYLIPLTLTQIKGEEGSFIYGTMSSLNCVVVVLCTAFITNFINKFTSIDRMILGNIFEVGGFVIFLLFINVQFMYYIAIFVFTIGEIINTITTNPHLTKRIPVNFRGRMISLMYVIENIIFAAGELIIGKIYDTKGMNTAWLVVISVGILSIIAYQLTKKEDRKTFPDLYK